MSSQVRVTREIERLHDQLADLKRDVAGLFNAGRGGGGWQAGRPDLNTGLAVGDTIFKFTTADVVVNGHRWLCCNTQSAGAVRTVGDASSSATAWASADAATIFAYLWNNISDTYCAVSGGRGASAAIDFAAHKRIGLPDWRDRYPLGKGYTATAMGGTDEEADDARSPKSHTHANTLAVANESAHTHAVGSLAAANESAHTHAVGSLAAANESSHTHASGTLGTDTVAAHNHSIGSVSVASDGAHTHTISGTLGTPDAHIDVQQYVTLAQNVPSNDHLHDVSGLSADSDGAHDHAVTAPGSTGNGGGHSHSVNAGATAAGDAHTHSMSGSSAAGSAHTHSLSGSSAAGSAHAHSLTGAITETERPHVICCMYILAEVT